MLSFNKNFMMEFNSTRGNWTGFTPYSMDVAKHTNNPIEKAIREFEKKILCLDNRNAIRTIGMINFLLLLHQINELNAVSCAEYSICTNTILFFLTTLQYVENRKETVATH